MASFFSENNYYSSYNETIYVVCKGGIRMTYRNEYKICILAKNEMFLKEIFTLLHDNIPCDIEYSYEHLVEAKTGRNIEDVIVIYVYTNMPEPIFENVLNWTFEKPVTKAHGTYMI